jgi:hypothetical protein
MNVSSSFADASCSEERGDAAGVGVPPAGAAAAAGFDDCALIPVEVNTSQAATATTRVARRNPDPSRRRSEPAVTAWFSSSWGGLGMRTSVLDETHLLWSSRLPGTSDER